MAWRRSSASSAQADARSLKNDAPRERSVLEHRAGAFAQGGLGRSRVAIGRRPQPLPDVAVLAQKQRDGRGRHETRRIRRRGQSRPADLAGEAQHVEHLRLVRDQTRRQDRALPRACRELEPVEHREDLTQPVDPGQPRGRFHVLPGEQEAHEVGGAHRFDLRAQPVQRVTVNARQQGAVAPFEGGFADCADFAAGLGIRDSGLGAALNRPRSTTPSDSSARSAASASRSAIPITPASASAVVGPPIVRRPRASSTIASSRVHTRADRDGGASIDGFSTAAG